MNMDTLPNEVDFVFFVEALPEDGLRRVAIAVEGMAAPIPTMLIAVDIDSALRIADRQAARSRPGRDYRTLCPSVRPVRCRRRRPDIEPHPHGLGRKGRGG